MPCTCMCEDGVIPHLPLLIICAKLKDVFEFKYESSCFGSIKMPVAKIIIITLLDFNAATHVCCGVRSHVSDTQWLGVLLEYETCIK